MTSNYYVAENSNGDVWLFDQLPTRCYTQQTTTDEETGEEVDVDTSDLSESELLALGGFWESGGKSYCLYTTEYGPTNVSVFLNIPVEYVDYSNWAIDPIEIVLDISLSEASQTRIAAMVSQQAKTGSIDFSTL